MKLTDKQIDKLFQDGAAKQSFAYKPEYWEEFSASLSDNTPLSEASDGDFDAAFQEDAANQSFEYKPEFWEEFSASLDTAPLSQAPDDALDAAFQEEAANQSFDYKPEFWEEFSASLPDNTPLSQAPDDALDAAFQEDASSISVDYKPEFWNEFSDELSSIAATENVTDSEVDALYREEAAKLSFVYHPAYWEDMAAMLRRRRRRPEFLWFGLSGVFATAIIAMFFVQQSPVSVPEFTWNGLNGTERNGNNVASNGTNPAENDVFQNGNNVQNVNNTELNPEANGNNPINLAHNANNGNNPINGANNRNGNNPVNGNQANVGPTLVTNNPQANPNNAQVMPRMNRIMPTLVMTTAHIEPKGRAIEGVTSQEDLTLNPLSAKAPETVTAFNNDLAEVGEFPGFRPYKRAPFTSLYVQGVGGISESLITPSDAFGTSYGIGAGITASRKNWTFNAGSNVVIENYNDLELTRVAKQYIHFSSTERRQDLQYKNLYSVELDLGLGYNFGRHQVRVGIRPSYTYNARVDYVETNVYNDQGETVETSESRQGQYGYLGALQLWGVKPTIGYAYHLPSNWSIGLNIGTELMPSINEEFISGVNNRLPLDGQLYIRRTLNFKK